MTTKFDLSQKEFLVNFLATEVNANFQVTYDKGGKLNVRENNGQSDFITLQVLFTKGFKALVNFKEKYHNKESVYHTKIYTDFQEFMGFLIEF